MQIHELNTKALTDPAYVAFDDGTDTYKADFKEVIDDAVAEAFSSADVSGGVVNYTSGDSESPTAWTNVSVMASGGTLATLMNRISTMVKNVRYLWSLIGSTSISNVSSTITGAIGNTSISGIGGGTLTGAVKDVNARLSNLQSGYFEVSVPANGYAEYTLQFPTTYTYVPALVCTPVIYSDPKFFSVILRGRFQGSGTLRISNTSGNATTVGVNWLAY